MSLTSRSINQLFIGALVLLCLIIGVGVCLVVSASRLPSASDVDSSMPVEPQWPVSTGVTVDESDWSVFQASEDGSSAAGGALAKRFRFAGRFFQYGKNKETSTRIAVIDDAKLHTQHIVKEGEIIEEGINVVSILRERVVLSGPLGEEELWLSFATRKDGEAALPAKATKLVSTGRFGSQTGKKSWVFKRSEIVDYYREVMDDPERLSAVFDSMKPVRNENRKITGYELDVVGEGQFFAEVGLEPGDIVRSVNSMKMTSRHRAEYFIKEFIADRVNIIIMEVERDGEIKKLVYRVR
jgi:type II secretory pathway component PulC